MWGNERCNRSEPFMFSVPTPTYCGGRQSGRDFRFQATQDFILKPKVRKLTPSAKPSDLFEDIRALIEQARAATARAINSAITLLYWQVGQRIRRDMLQSGKHQPHRKTSGQVSDIRGCPTRSKWRCPRTLQGK